MCRSLLKPLAHLQKQGDLFDKRIALFQYVLQREKDGRDQIVEDIKTILPSHCEVMSEVVKDHPMRSSVLFELMFIEESYDQVDEKRIILNMCILFIFWNANVRNFVKNNLSEPFDVAITALNCLCIFRIGPFVPSRIICLIS